MHVRVALGLAVALLGAGLPRASGQVTTGPVARGDVAVYTGLFSLDSDEVDPPGTQPDYDHWINTALFDVSAGYYWTDHLKTEVEALWTSEGQSYGSTVIYGPAGQIGWIPHTSRVSTQQFGVAQLWQFGRNAMFHPWVGAGVDYVRTEHELDRPAQFAYPSGPGPAPPPVRVPALYQQTITHDAVPFGSVGFKAYFNERTFFRTDLKVQIRSGVHHVVWKLGAGVDF